MRKIAVVVLILSSLGSIQAAQRPAKLDTTTFVVIGEGLAAGMADFALRDVYQRNNFPALMAQKFHTAFPQPLIQPPGIGSVPGFPELPVALPGPYQTSVRTPFPPTLFIFNLSIPGQRLNEALNLRPIPPLVQQNNSKQSITNIMLGFPAMILGVDKPLWTQVEYAVAMNPTLVLVELGYAEALEAAVRGDASLMPDPAAFRGDYSRLLDRLKATFAQIIVTTIPDPFDTAYFSSVSAVAALTGVPAATLVSRYGIRDSDLLAPSAIGPIASSAAALPRGSVISAARAAAVSDRVRALNTEISNLGKQPVALLYDLNGLFARVRANGLTAGTYQLTANYLGGFYSLSGSFPGMTGQALIANEILALINQTFGTSYDAVDLAKVASTDPAVKFRPHTVPR